MPRFPLFNGGQSIQTQAPGPLQSSPGGNQGLRVSTAGVSDAIMGGFARLDKAEQQPKLPYSLADSGGQAIAQGLGAIGQSLGEAGNVLMQIGEKEKQAKEIKAMADLQIATAKAEGDYFANRENDNDYDGYTAKWQSEAVDRVRGQFADANLPPAVKDRLEQRLSLWAIQGNTAARSMGQKKLFADTKQSKLLTVRMAADKGDMESVRSGIGELVGLGVMSPAEGDVHIYNETERVREQSLRAVENKLAAAEINGDETGMTKLVDDAAKYFKEGDGQIERLRAHVKTKVEAVKRDRAYNSVLDEAASDPGGTADKLMQKGEDGKYAFYGDLSNDDRDRLANHATSLRNHENAKRQTAWATLAVQGEVLNETALLASLNKKEITPEFYQSLKSMNDARRPDVTPDVANRIVTKAAAYDPDDDTPARENYFALYDEATKAGLSKRQLGVFQDTINEATKRNADANGKSETAAVTFGRNEIQRLHDNEQLGVRYKESGFLSDALADPDKLKAFGFKPDDVKKLAALDGPARLSEFRRMAKETDGHGKPFRTVEPEAYNKLSDFTKSLFDKATNAGEFTDETNRLESAKREAALLNRFDVWYKSQKEKPSADAIKNWINTETKAVRQGSAIKALSPSPQAMRAPSSDTMKPIAETKRYSELEDGSLAGTASSYGYKGDDDNGFNSLGMRRGKQPWYGEHPTVALAPEVARKLGVQLPAYNKETKEFDTSKSFVEIEVGGKKIRAIYDENGMYIDQRSKDKLVDLTPEASAALGLPVKSNAKVIVRKVA